MSAFILKQAAYLFFLLFLSKYFDYLKLESFKRKFVILFFLVSVSPFVEFYVSDLVATVICLWGFYFFIRYLDKQKHRDVFFSISLLGLSYFVKYSFLPFIFFPSVAFLLKERKTIFKKWKQWAFIIIVTIGAVLLFYFLNKWLVGDMQIQTAMDAFHGHPHFSQLSRTDGFLFTFGTFEWVFENLIKNHAGVQIQFNWISILVTLYFYILFCKLFFSTRPHSLSSYFKNSINISLSAGFLILFFLAFLTINNPGQTWTTPPWTFVQETRYYAPVIIIGLINILVLFLTLKKGSLLHILVLLMFVFNFYAYRTVMQNGFWGNNYKSYLVMKKNISNEIDPAHLAKRPVVYFDKNTKNSYYYFYLQANGIILLPKEKVPLHNSSLFANYVLKKGAAGSFTISRIN